MQKTTVSQALSTAGRGLNYALTTIMHKLDDERSFIAYRLDQGKEVHPRAERAITELDGIAFTLETATTQLRIAYALAEEAAKEHAATRRALQQTERQCAELDAQLQAVTAQLEAASKPKTRTRKKPAAKAAG